MINFHKPTEDSHCQRVVWLFGNLLLVRCLLCIVGIFISSSGIRLGCIVFWVLFELFGLLNICVGVIWLLLANNSAKRFPIWNWFPTSIRHHPSPTVHSVLSQFRKESQNIYKVASVLCLSTLLLLSVIRNRSSAAEIMSPSLKKMINIQIQMRYFGKYK